MESSQNLTDSKVEISCQRTNYLKLQHNCMYVPPISGIPGLDMCRKIAAIKGVLLLSVPSNSYFDPKVCTNFCASLSFYPRNHDSNP